MARFRITDLKDRVSIKSIEAFGFGLSWDTSASDHEIAERLVSFLEDRRVLFSRLATRCPEGAVESVDDIRDRLQSERERLDRTAPLFEAVTSLQRACRTFIEYACGGCKDASCWSCSRHDAGCVDGLRILRQTFGVILAVICSNYGLSINEELFSILPEGSAAAQDYGISV